MAPDLSSVVREQVFGGNEKLLLTCVQETFLTGEVQNTDNIPSTAIYVHIKVPICFNF
jgi:hypothetical protein